VLMNETPLEKRGLFIMLCLRFKVEALGFRV